MSYGRRIPPNTEGMISLKVDNLTYRTTAEMLKRVFEKYGDVGDVYIPRDPYTNDSRGFAFVRYFDERDADDAIDGLNGTVLDGRELRVQRAKHARPPQSSNYSSRRSAPAPRRSHRRSYSRSRSRSRDRRRRRSRSHSHSRSGRHDRRSSRDRSQSGRRNRSRSGSKSPRHSRSHSLHNDRVAMRTPSRSPSAGRNASRSLERGRNGSAERSHSRSPEQRSRSPSQPPVNDYERRSSSPVD